MISQLELSPGHDDYPILLCKNAHWGNHPPPIKDPEDPEGPAVQNE